MDEAARKGPAGRAVPWGLVGTIALVVLAERFVARNAMDFLDSDDWAYRTSDRVAQTDARRYDLLCFGESLLKLGVVPQAVHQRTGRTAYNLAVSGSQAPATYFLFRRAIEAGARPRAVVVDFSPMKLRDGPRHTLNRWASLLGPADTARLACWARDADLFAAVAIGRWLPSVYARAGLRDGLTAALKGASGPRTWANYLSLRNWRKNDGAHLFRAGDGLDGFNAERAAGFRQGFYPRWACHPANAEAIGQFLALAEARGVPVYWVLPPLHPALHADLDRSGIEAHHEAFVRSWQARFPGLIVLDGRGTVSEPSGFFDPNHLSAVGAYAFSLTLGDALRRPPPARWVKLPACRVGPLPDGVEDVDASRLALEAAKIRIRR